MSTLFNITGRLYGRLNTNIERGMPQDKVPFAAFTVGSYNWKNKENDFYDCVAFGRNAESVAKFFTPKRAVSVSGRIGISKYKNKAGDETKKVQFTATTIDYPTDGEGVPSMQAVHAQSVNQEASQKHQEERPEPPAVPTDPDDLPF
jgi:single-strand DNA-binding protein